MGAHRGFPFHQAAPDVTLTDRIRTSPLGAFFFLACAFTWPLAGLTALNLGFGLLALFGPAAAALIVARTVDGKPGTTALRQKVRLWRVAPIWYAIVFLLPLAVSGVVSLLALALGRATSAHLTPINPIGLVLFVLVLGEELGW